MKKSLVVSLLMALMMIVSAAAAVAQEIFTEEEPQKLSEFGDQVCGIMKSNPAGMIDLVPLRFVVRVALVNGAGSEEDLQTLLYDSGTTMDEMIDTTLEDSGMLEEDAGAEFFGETPVDICYWSNPVEMECDDMYIALAREGLMSGTISATPETLKIASEEYQIQGCATLNMVAADEDLDLTLLMFDKLWYMVGNLTKPEESNSE